MASPCANCVFKGTKWCGIICGKWWLVALLLFFAVSSWAVCYNVNYEGYFCPGCSSSCESDGTTTCAEAPKCSVCPGGVPAVCNRGSGQFLTGASVADYCRTNWRRVVTLAWTRVCDTQAEADSVYCELNPDDESCAPPRCDSTYTCQSVFTENNVLRSEVTLTDCNGNVLAQRYVIGSCGENGFCQGSEVAGSDSCTYDSVDPSKCRSGGQNGSLCTYVCPDGQLHTCRIAWNAGTPSEYQPCPSVPAADCVTPRSSSSVSSSPSVDDLPDNPGGTSYGSSSSGSGYDPESSCPECDILIAIRDTLHRANDQRRYQNYILDTMKANIGGFGAQFDKIIGNTREQVTQGNAIKNSLSSIASSNLDISDKLNDLDLDDITIDSVVVHVDLDSISPPQNWNFFDLDSLPVWRDTVSDIHRAVDDVVKELDSLKNDSTNFVTKYLPFIKKMSDKLDNLTGDCEGMECLYRPVIDTLLLRLRGELGLDTLTPQQQGDIEDDIVRLTDSSYVDGNWYCEEFPDAEFCYELDSLALDSLTPRPPDSLDFIEFIREQDSLMFYIDSVLKDTTQDTIGFDQLAGDSAKIREKLDFLFLPQNTLEQCFDFRLNTTLGKWTYNLFIDFADLFGLDLCDLIRKIVRLLTFILIVFTTIKGYIRAFGGGGSGGDV